MSEVGKVVFIPPIPLNAFPYSSFIVTVQKVHPAILSVLIDFYKDRKAEFKSYIRHESTVKVINEAFGLDLQPSSELYQYSKDDLVIIVGLRKPIRGKEVEVKLEDLDFAVINVLLLSAEK